jgi:hypothetical protein
VKLLYTPSQTDRVISVSMRGSSSLYLAGHTVSNNEDSTRHGSSAKYTIIG